MRETVDAEARRARVAAPADRDPGRRPPAAAAGRPALIAVWALAGFYLSLGPALARLLAGSHSLVLGGLTVFAFAASAGVTVLFVQTAAPRNVLYLGTAALATGVGITLAATSITSIGAFFLGTVVAGVGIGSGFQGVLRTLLPLVAPHERAGVLSTIYVDALPRDGPAGRDRGLPRRARRRADDRAGVRRRGHAARPAGARGPGRAAPAARSPRAVRDVPGGELTPGWIRDPSGRVGRAVSPGRCSSVESRLG